MPCDISVGWLGVPPPLFLSVDLVSPPFFGGMTWCPLPFSVGWLGVPAPWVDLVSPPLGLTWCPLPLWVDLVSLLLGWLGVPAPWVALLSPLQGLTWCPRSFGQLCDDLLMTGWPHPHLADLVMATTLVDCVMTFCRLVDEIPIGRPCDNLLSTWWRKSPLCRLSDDNPPLLSTWWRQSPPSCWLGDDNPFFLDLVTATLAVDCVMTFCRLGDDHPHWPTVWGPLVDLTPVVHCVMTLRLLRDDIPFGQLCLFGLTQCPLPPWVDIGSPVMQFLGGSYVNFRPCVDFGLTTAYCIDCVLSLWYEIKQWDSVSILQSVIMVMAAALTH